MSIAKITEISATSSSSFEDAIRSGLERASRTLKNIKGAWVKQQKVTCGENGKVKEYRVDLKVTFVLED